MWDGDSTMDRVTRRAEISSALTLFSAGGLTSKEQSRLVVVLQEDREELAGLVATQATAIRIGVLALGLGVLLNIYMMV